MHVYTNEKPFECRLWVLNVYRKPIYKHIFLFTVAKSHLHVENVMINAHRESIYEDICGFALVRNPPNMEYVVINKCTQKIH